MVKFFYDNTKNTDLFYKLKLTVPDAFYFIDTGIEQIIYLDKRELGVISEKNKNPNLKILPLEPLIEAVKNIEGKYSTNFKIAQLILKLYKEGEIHVGNNFPIDLYEFLQQDGFKLQAVKQMYPSRLIKNQEEVGNIREALLKTQKAYSKIEAILKSCAIQENNIIFNNQVLTSEFLKYEVEKIMLEEGMENVEGMIISSGTQAAMPHHDGAGSILANSSIIVDLFPRDKKNGYFADMTRTYCKGEPSEQLQKMYAAVQKAQEAAIAMIAPGVKTADVHQKCIDIFLADGFHVGEKGFIHGTGHGLGLEIHEAPYLKITDEVLQVGNVVTVEPGLYYPEFGGVRLEDVVVVIENGCENLTNYPKKLIPPEADKY